MSLAYPANFFLERSMVDSYLSSLRIAPSSVLVGYSLDLPTQDSSGK